MKIRWTVDDFYWEGFRRSRGQVETLKDEVALAHIKHGRAELAEEGESAAGPNEPEQAVMEPPKRAVRRRGRPRKAVSRGDD